MNFPAKTSTAAMVTHTVVTVAAVTFTEAITRVIALFVGGSSRFDYLVVFTIFYLACLPFVLSMEKAYQRTRIQRSGTPGTPATAR